MHIIKRFLEWIKLKEKLHGNASRPPLFKEGEIWWASVGENIGSEINGKSKLFSRPVIIFKKLSANTFLGIPTSSLDKNGSWYIQVHVHDVSSVAILSQIRILDYKRLSTKMGRLHTDDFKRVKAGLKKLYFG